MAGPDYLQYAEAMLGSQEGQRALSDYLRGGGQYLDPATRAWCAAFVNSTLQQAGYKGTGSDLAKSFLNYGQAVDQGGIQAGDLGVWDRGGQYGHVGIVEEYDKAHNRVKLLSGNSGAHTNEVTSEWRDASTAMAFRRPQAEAAAAQVQAAGGSPEQVQKAFLDTIAGTESPGYDVLYGGGKFTDFSHHPNQAVSITSGPNAGKTSSAAGRYQFLGSTWDTLQKKYGYKDFSAANQDTAAWQYAQDIYKEKTSGGSLQEALQSGDPGRINAAAKILNSVWTSLPGGIEQNKGYGSKTFADVYSGNFGKAGGTPIGGSSGAPASGGAPTADGGGREDLTKLLAGLKKDDTKHNWMTALGEGLSGMKGGSGVKFAGAPSAGPSEAPRVDAPAVSPLAARDPNKRQYLAQLMAQLNSGRLFAG
jgi:uncharacterized protein (TIGR02594 family)